MRIFGYTPRQFFRKTCLDIMFICSTIKSKTYWLIGTPVHGNLGDQAIAIAQKKMISETVKGSAVIEITGYDFNAFLPFMKKKIKPDDTIIISGGGFLGDLWVLEDDMTLKIVETFRNNEIIISPQTIFYDDYSIGNDRLRRAKEIYEANNNLYFCLRERNSYSLVKRMFSLKNGEIFAPDLVLYLNELMPKYNRTNVLLCLRQDKEKVIDAKIINRILEYCKEKKFNVQNTTTVLERNMWIFKRKYYVKKKLREFKKSKLVITDRLHAMLFCAITGTPCLAFDNITKKVSGVYEWIKHLDYIILHDSNEDIYKELEYLLSVESKETTYLQKDDVWDELKSLYLREEH